MFLLFMLLNSHLLIVCAENTTFFDKKKFAFCARKMAQESCAKKLAQFLRFFYAKFLHRINLWSYFLKCIKFFEKNLREKWHKILVPKNSHRNFLQKKCAKNVQFFFPT